MSLLGRDGFENLNAAGVALALTAAAIWAAYIVVAASTAGRFTKVDGRVDRLLPCVIARQPSASEGYTLWPRELAGRSLHRFRPGPEYRSRRQHRKRQYRLAVVLERFMSRY